MTTLTQRMQQWRHAKQTMAYLQDGTRTYADFYHDIHDMAASVRTHTQATWALWHEDSYLFAVGLFALLASGKEVVLPPNRVSATETWLAEQGIAFWEFPSLPSVITNPLVPLPNWGDDSWQHAPIVLFTSGSTGAPKRIQRTLGQLMRELNVLQTLFPWPADSVVVATVSHQHLFGLCYKILLPLQQAGAFVATQCYFPEDVAQCQAHLPSAHTILVSSPAFLSRWHEPQAACKFAQIVSSGGPLPQDVPRQLQRDIIEILGSSESGGIAWRHANQTWQAFPNVRMRIDDTQQLWVQTEHAHTHTWMTTGDSACLSPAGTGFELLGRMDRIIKLEEKRLSLDTIENHLTQHPLITDAHVCLLQHPNKTQLATVCVLNETGWNKLQEEGKRVFVQGLKHHLASHLEPIAVPKRWRFERSLPRNSQAKLDHVAIRRCFDTHVRPIAHTTNSDANHAQISLWFPAELVCFQGHFPGLPIYPGVAQIDVVQHHARTLLPAAAVCVGMEQLKFQHPIKPYDEVVLKLERHALKIHFTLSRDGMSLASGRLCFVEQTT